MNPGTDSGFEMSVFSAWLKRRSLFALLSLCGIYLSCWAGLSMIRHTAVFTLRSPRVFATSAEMTSRHGDWSFRIGYTGTETRAECSIVGIPDATKRHYRIRSFSESWTFSPSTRSPFLLLAVPLVLPVWIWLATAGLIVMMLLPSKRAPA